ncbi:MAG TPA: hypothetical protein VEL07_14855 [Planctomycetota bacterium]|nr:hypothetical protein [Planctomycetota bacterium]
MDAASLTTAEELVLGLGLAVTAWLGLAIARRLLAYALSGGMVVVGIAAAAALMVYKPSRVYGFVEREAYARWSDTPSSEQLVDKGIAALDWCRARLSETKSAVDDELYQRPASPNPSPAPSPQASRSQPEPAPEPASEAPGAATSAEARIF